MDKIIDGTRAEKNCCLSGIGIMVLGLLPLTGCGATDAQQRVSSIQLGFAQIAAVNATCRSLAAAKPENRTFVAKLPMRLDQASPFQLADKKTVRPEERPALLTYLTEIKGCQDVATNTESVLIPELAPARAAAQAQIGLIRENLLNGEITWGEANSRGMQLAIEYRTSSGAILDSVRQQLAYQHQTTMDNRAAAVQLVGGILSAAVEGAALGVTSPRPYVYAPTYVRYR